MARQECMLLGNPRQSYYVDAEGRVWNRKEGGTAWKECAYYDQIGACWVYASGSIGPLILLPANGTHNNVAQPAPPIGLRPDFVAVAEYDKARCKEIGEAILRYATAMLPIPQAWLDELQELTDRNQPTKSTNTEKHH